MENLLVALTNVPCVIPILTSLKQRDYVTATCVAFVSLASIVSHLFENHKHGMPGLGLSPTVSYYLNRADVIGCIVVVTRFLQLYTRNYGSSITPILQNKSILVAFLVSFFCLRVSEYTYSAKYKWSLYIPFHSLWHLSIFPLMSAFLDRIIY